MEKHEDSEPEIVDVEFQIPEKGRAIAANEYRNKDYTKSKASDILCILLDDSRKQLLTYLFDIKRTITGYDETKSVEELRKRSGKTHYGFYRADTGWYDP